MKTIWKFELKVGDKQTVEMPEGAEILTAQFQGDTLCLWALVRVIIPSRKVWDNDRIQLTRRNIPHGLL